VREVEEELGVKIKRKYLRPLHIMSRGPHDDTGPRVDYFFGTTKWEGIPTNIEPHKCDELRSHPLNGLPDSVPFYVRKAPQQAYMGVFYSEHDWSK
jgi:8-oxo-dGTP pyrophosphatase MutT (NUDIX family)